MDAFLALSPQVFVAIAVMFSALAGVITFLVFTRSELSRLQAGYDALMEYLGDGETKDIIQELTNAIRSVEYENRLKQRDIDQIYELLASCVQKVSIVRYNAFGNTGSDLSYSIALLDSNDNGVVLSSLYGRETSTAYAKPVKGGQSKYILTDEERKAIAGARKKAISRLYYGNQGAAVDTDYSDA